MHSIPERRGEICGAMMHQALQRLQSMGFPKIEGDGNLLTPKATKISLATPVDQMVIAQRIVFARLNGPDKYLGFIVGPSLDGAIQASIMTSPDEARHIVQVTDADITESLSLLRGLVDEVLEEICAEGQDRRT